MPTPYLESQVWRSGRLEPDDWIFLDDADDAPVHGKIAVSKARFLRQRSDLIDRTERIGIYLDSGEWPGDIGEDLRHIRLFALHFPKFTDGRNYSIARLLRDRLRFAGEIRARGEVLRDQIAFMLRAGFDAIEASDPRTVNALRDGMIGRIRHHFQPSSDPTEENAAGFTWRRISAQP